MAGNGEFEWFWGKGEEPEKWHGGFPAEANAQDQAAGRFPKGGYTIIEADRAAIDPAIFDGRMILIELQCHTPNSDCWTGDMPVVAQSEVEDLEAKLGDCLDRWLRKHKFDATTAVHTIRQRTFHPERLFA
ncbi:hypothetical protein SAMN05216456_1278 [Devosia crocina]|uniref:Uncharacterized protein n=1 Tax=Devosia crocina TaxID=429728 RepID=A0A1I7N988_9HYPH|nr:hypothetical protein [Devosia crocina]SFV31240.1 hypothetical protein SAMN05216456_1278 [Devosia crocina]